ncbi:hypothetical protein [Exilibacterium tricleocarpae]|nr:hypothetical protein [Exilibacterium tricleocarpae]
MRIATILVTVSAAAGLHLPVQAQEEPLIKLESNFIGDKEQPSVSYFIPWKEIGTPDKLLWNIDSKYDKTLNLVDRQVLLRATGMYDEMNLESGLTLAEDK